MPRYSSAVAFPGSRFRARAGNIADTSHPKPLPPLQEQLVGIQVLGIRLNRDPVAPKLNEIQGFGQFGDDGAGDLILDLENVLRGKLAIEGLRPQVLVSTGVDQLGGDSDGAAR